jgi:hypothetical protein
MSNSVDGYLIQTNWPDLLPKHKELLNSIERDVYLYEKENPDKKWTARRISEVKKAAIVKILEKSPCSKAWRLSKMHLIKRLSYRIPYESLQGWMIRYSSSYVPIEEHPYKSNQLYFSDSQLKYFKEDGVKLDEFVFKKDIYFCTDCNAGWHEDLLIDKKVLKHCPSHETSRVAKFARRPYVLMKKLTIKQIRKDDLKINLPDGVNLETLEEAALDFIGGNEK